MAKQQVIDILENFRPRDKYCTSPVDDYVDDMIDSRIDSIIEFVKREPDNEWIECRKKMPDYGKEVLVCDANYGNVFNAVRCRKRKGQGDSWFTDCDYINYKAFTHWMPLPEPPKGVK